MKLLMAIYSERPDSTIPSWWEGGSTKVVGALVRRSARCAFPNACDFSGTAFPRAWDGAISWLGLIFVESGAEATRLPLGQEAPMSTKLTEEWGETIVFADDSEIMRTLVRCTFKPLGYRVEEACDGKDALAKIEVCRPDVVILDIEMPIMDGFEVIRRLREDERFWCLPVLAVTAIPYEEYRVNPASRGFTGYLWKPVSVATLVSVVERHLAYRSGVRYPEKNAPTGI
jgi:CheY-like chemotaxis protein